MSVAGSVSGILSSGEDQEAELPTPGVVAHAELGMPRLLQELCTVTDLAPQAKNVTARALRQTKSTPVVQECYLSLDLAEIKCTILTTSTLGCCASWDGPQGSSLPLHG